MDAATHKIGVFISDPVSNNLKMKNRERNFTIKIYRLSDMLEGETS